MPSFDESFPLIEVALAGRYGHLGLDTDRLDDPFAASVAALLGQSIDAKKVARAIGALAEAGLLDAQTMAEADSAELVDAFKTAGVSVPPRIVGPLRRLAGWIVDRHHGSAGGLSDESVSTSSLREELAALNGIGPATADAILLLGLRRAVYPVDRASYRILVRHGWLDESSDYDEARSVLERPGGDDPDRLARLSAWFERVGQEFCKPSAPRCERCPLRPFLPEDGPRGTEAPSGDQAME